MISKNDFLNQPKIDAHNHLNLGMRYDSYKIWAGFEIPDFPKEKYNGLGEMHEYIGNYTRPRAATAQDAEDLITMSIEDAIADGVSVLEGSIDIQFVGHCENSIDNFLAMVSRIKENFKDKIDFRPELGMGKLFPKEKISAWAPACIESGIFKSIDLYGPEVFEGLEDFKPLYDLAGKHGIKRKAHVGEFSDAKSVKQFIDYFELDEVQHGIGAVQDEEILKYLVDKKIRCNVTPASNVMLTAVDTLENHPIRKMYDAGVRLTICTDDLIFFNKSVSEQCADMVNCGLFTKEEILAILASEK